MKSALFKWLMWLGVTLSIVAFLGFELLEKEQKPNLLIGVSSHGHYQIELQCEACHTSPLGGPEILQNACENCHQEELKAALDSHPRKKFTDPRNAERIAHLDARFCTSCHREHNPDITHAMGVTVPDDYCVECHKDVGDERETHKGMAFDTCATAGCHNFHDNLALYENFLLKHAHDPTLIDGTQPARHLGKYLETIGQAWQTSNPKPLPQAFEKPEIHQEWLGSAHGQAQVACSNCHLDSNGDWFEKPDHQVCETCHQQEVSGFLTGKHGMRLAQGLSPMTPGIARLPMHADASHQELTCNSCHLPHKDDTRQAAVEACLGCHADEHSLAYKQSPHFALWQKAENGEIPHDKAVSCATCHMPRLTTEINGIERIQVEHNQNATLRPNEKMIRPTCMTCHGLGFAIDALADDKLIENNFNGIPGHHIPSIDMAIERDKPTTF